MPVEITGFKEISSKLGALDKALDKPTLNTIGAMVVNVIEDSFESETSPFGKRWTPISANTAFAYSGGKHKTYTKNRKKQTVPFLRRFGSGGSKRILVDSGALSSKWLFSSTISPKAAEVIVSNNSSFKGFAYGLTHQFGTNNAWGRGVHIPARPFLPVQGAKFEPRLEKRILEYLDKKIKEKLG